jgi:hypothetical protein
VSNKVDLRAVKIKQLGEIFWKKFRGRGTIFDFLKDSGPLEKTELYIPKQYQY